MNRRTQTLLDDLIECLETLSDKCEPQVSRPPENYVDLYYHARTLASNIDARVKYTSDAATGLKFLVEECLFDNARATANEIREDLFGPSGRLGTEQFRIDDDTKLK